MLGTGLSASSLSESTIPSTTSSSSTEGTYCRQIGSFGDLIRSTMAGEIRNSKFSAACRSRSSSGKFSGPNFWASASKEAIEFCLRTSCHVSAMEPSGFHKHHLIVARRIEVRDHRHGGIAPGLVKGPGAGVIGPARGLDDDEPDETGEPPLHLRQKRRADAAALDAGIDRHPVQIVGAQGARRRTPADPAAQEPLALCPEDGVGVGGAPTHRLIEDFERDGDLVLTKQSHRPGDGLDAPPVGFCQVAKMWGDGGAAHAADTPLTRAAAARWLCERVSASSTICITRSS